MCKCYIHNRQTLDLIREIGPMLVKKDKYYAFALHK
jgi:hypothetical protein